MPSARRSTDQGTVILHALLATSLVVVVATGLRIATDDPEAEWIAVLDPVLPVEHLWYYHLVAGIVLAATLTGYAVYLVRARLTPRIRLDVARLLAMLRPGRSRWGAINILVYWTLIIALLIEIATGLLLFSGAGRSVLVVHLDATFVCIGAVAAHIALHAAYGGISQLARVIRPAPLVVAPPPPDLADVLAEHLARTSPGLDATRTDEPRELRSGEPGPRAVNGRATSLHAHPLATALAVGIGLSICAVGAEQSTRPTLHVVGIAPGEGPKLDGDISDPVWARATPATVLTTQGGDFGGTHESLVEVRAVHDGVYAYFAFVWNDPTRSLKHMPLVKRAGRWFVAASRADLTDEHKFNEDKFSVLFAKPGLPLIGAAIHLARRPLSDKPPSTTARGLHYTVGPGIADVWQWRASHAGAVGHVDNCHFGNAIKPDGQGGEPGHQYAGGFALDPGPPGYATNVLEVRDDAGRPVLLPKRMPRDLPATLAALGRVASRDGESESEGARWWMTQEETVPYSAALDANVPDGTVLPSIIVPEKLEMSATSVRGAARWAAGRWTLEIARRLYTGSANDIAIKSGVLMWVAAFDHSEKRHTRHLRPFRLEVD